VLRTSAVLNQLMCDMLRHDGVDPNGFEVITLADGGICIRRHPGAVAVYPAASWMRLLLRHVSRGYFGGLGPPQR